MAKPARVLIRDAEILQWTSIRVESFRLGSRTPRIRNGNRLIGTYPGADGLKTGYIRRSKFNLTATVKRGHKRIISVIIGRPRTSGAPPSRRACGISVSACCARVPEQVGRPVPFPSRQSPPVSLNVPPPGGE